MGMYPLNIRHVSRFADACVRATKEKRDTREFRMDCDIPLPVHHYPLRYPSAVFFRRDPKRDVHRNPHDNDSDAPFGFEPVSIQGKKSLTEMHFFVNLFGYEQNAVILNGLTLIGPDYFGLDGDDPLPAIVEAVSKKQLAGYQDARIRFDDDLAAIAERYGKRHDRYRRKLAETPTMPRTLKEETTSYVEGFFNANTPCIGYMTIVLCDLERRMLMFGTETGAAGLGDETRYYRMLGFGDGHAEMIGYCKKKGEPKRIHPFMIGEEELEKNARRELTELIMLSEKSKELFAALSRDYRRAYSRFVRP